MALIVGEILFNEPISRDLHTPVIEASYSRICTSRNNYSTKTIELIDWVKPVN